MGWLLSLLRDLIVPVALIILAYAWGATSKKKTKK